MSDRRDSPTRLARLGRLTNDPKSAVARVFVGNISVSSVNDVELRDVFAKYGEISGVSMHNQGKYAFVQFATEEQAHSAIQGAAGQMVGGMRIDVRPAVDKKSGSFGHHPRSSSYERRPAPSSGPPRSSTSGSSHSYPSSGSPGASRKLARSDFRLFDVGQTRGAAAAAQRPSSEEGSSWGGESATAAPAPGSAPSPPDYSGSPGARYAAPSGSAAKPAPSQESPHPGHESSQTAERVPAPDNHHHHDHPPPPARPASPPRSRPPHDDHHYGRSRSPHYAPAPRPVSPERHRGRSRSPGWYRHEEEHRRYQYEMQRWEEEERYRRWYYEHYGSARHGERERYDHYYRDHHYEREHERHRHDSRYKDYLRRQEDGRHAEYYRSVERERRHSDEYYDHHRRHPDRYPAEPAPRPVPPPARPEQHQELFNPERRASSAPPPPSQPQKPPLDSLVLMVAKQQQGYAHLISHRLREAGMLSETREMPASASLADIISAGIKRKLLYLFVVTSDNEMHRSLSVHILHTSPVQEHKNMPFDDAQELVKTNFEEYCADVRAGRIPSRLAPANPTGPPGQAGRNNGAPAAGRTSADNISQDVLSSLLSSLREKQAVEQEQQPTQRTAPSDRPRQNQSADADQDGEAPKFNWNG